LDTSRLKQIDLFSDQVRALRRDMPDLDERLQQAMEEHGG